MGSFISMTHQLTAKKNIAICGGGLVGAMEACFLAKRGFNVEVFEKRPDPRKEAVVSGRSINLSLSARGLEALRRVGLEAGLRDHCVPVHSRMVHGRDGGKVPVMFGSSREENLLCMKREVLNISLLEAAETFSNVKIYFRHKFVKCNFKTGEVVFLHQGAEVRRTVDLVIGCDGAFSAVRQEIARNPDHRFSCRQYYTPLGYMQLEIPPTPDDQFAMEMNYIHFWSHDEVMMVAMPNMDRSFTVNLGLPFSRFQDIRTEDQVMELFSRYFPDSIPLFTESYLRKAFLQSKVSPLVTTKCYPHHVGDRCLLMGDAAHAMLPYYAQGTNCGFEDCIVFDELLEKYANDFTRALPKYTEVRPPDVDSMCDVTVYGLPELRTANTLDFNVRKKVDISLHKLFNSKWIPFYKSIAFTRIPYRECVAHRHWQNQVLSRTMLCLGAVLVLSAWLWIFGHRF